MKMFTLKLLPKLKSEKGSLLILSYFVILIMLGIGASFMLMSTNESLVAERQRMSTVAFHVAEAGIERALYDLRMDFVNGGSNPSWADGGINGHVVGPNTGSYYTIPYTGTTINGAIYTAQLKNVAGVNEDIWVRSTGAMDSVDHRIDVYARMISLSPWDYAIFAGSGASGAMVNGNVDIRGSVLILGSGLNPGDYAIDLGGTAEIVGNNYTGMENALRDKLPALPTTTVNGETVETLNAVLRVKKGLVGLSGSSTVGQVNVSGNGTKETVDGVYSNEGFGGNQGTSSVFSDNGTAAPYDLGDAVAFPSLSDPYLGYATYQSYLQANALVLTTELASVTPGSSFSYSNANGSISMDGGGNMAISGIVYVNGNNNVTFSKQGSDQTITYTGNGSLLVTGNVNINASIVTNGNSSFPVDASNNKNVIGIMTPNDIVFNEAQINVMGVFYAENQVTVQKQTDITGTIVSNYFNMGTNVPAIYQVPDVANNLPPGMIGGNARWYMLVGWLKDII